MSTIERITEIVLDSQISVPSKEVEVISLLSREVDRGVPCAVQCLLETRDDRVSEFVATYLQLLPGADEEKTQVAEHLWNSGALARSAARLVPWVAKPAIERFVADYTSDPKPGSPRSDVIFTIAIYYPELLRPCADKIESPLIRQSLLSGAPDELVSAFIEAWQAEGDIDQVYSAALTRTPYAASRVESLREEIEDPEDWHCLIELAGRLPDTGTEAGFRPSLMASVTDRSESDHTLGGIFPHDVPLCLRCLTPTDRVLTLAARSLPFTLSQDPSFFWFTCDCPDLDSVTVRVTDSGLRVYLGELGAPRAEPILVPGERSLTLERHPNQSGVSLNAVPGRSQHQVGGLPRWPSVEDHPTCPECGNFMPFLASIDSGPTPFGSMRFDGTLFGFWCENCSISTTQIQY